MIFGETIVLLTCYNLLCFTDFVMDAPTKVTCGTAMMTITIFGIAIYLIVILKDAVQGGVLKGKKRYLYSYKRNQR